VLAYIPTYFMTSETDWAPKYLSENSCWVIDVSLGLVVTESGLEVRLTLLFLRPGTHKGL
jgi:hypothetical protein